MRKESFVSVSASLLDEAGGAASSQACETAGACRNAPDCDTHAELECVLLFPSRVHSSVIVKEATTAGFALVTEHEDSQGDDPCEPAAARQAMEASGRLTSHLTAVAASSGEHHRHASDSEDADHTELR